MLKNPVLWIIVALIGMLAFVFWPQEEAKQNMRRGGAALVEVAEVSIQSYDETISALGNAQANESIELTANSTERVEEIHFEDGDVVEQGQLLVTMQHDEERANIAEYQALLTEQKRQLNRLLDLKKQSATAESAIETQQSLIDSTKAKQQVAKARFDEKFIHAPFSGQLGLRHISPGQLVMNNTKMVTLDDLSQIKVEFQLPEKYLTKVQVGQKVEAKHVAFEQPFVGKLSSISSRVDKSSRAFSVRAIFDNKDKSLRPGMLLQLRITTEASVTLVIPESAIVPINNDHYVYLVDSENKVTKTKVELGRRKPGSAEVVAGLKAGDNVVHKGVLKVRNGATVNVAGANNDVKEN